MANQTQCSQCRSSVHQGGVEKDDQLQSLLAEWKADYNDAAYKFREATVKVQVTKWAIGDLARYAGALDKAIMKYHSLKMEIIALYANLCLSIHLLRRVIFAK